MVVVVRSHQPGDGEVEEQSGTSVTDSLSLKTCKGMSVVCIRKFVSSLILACR